MTDYARWLATARGRPFATYEALWRWSTEDLEGFWGSLWEYFGVRPHAPARRVLAEPRMPGADWFPGAELNYAEHVLSRRDAGLAVIGCHEAPGDGGGLVVRRLTRAELAWQVAGVAAGLRALGVRRGDRVAAYLGNGVEALVAFLATASLGAIWSSCSPEFGAPSVVDRFRQITPRVLFATEGYRYGGREHRRSDVVAAVERALPSLAATVLVPGPGGGERGGGERGGGERGGGETGGAETGGEAGREAGRAGSVRRIAWDDLPGLAGAPAAPAVPPAGDGEPDAPAAGEASDRPFEPPDLRFEAVPFAHPLWILYSSGTTGLPKPIVQSHGGILLEHLKLLGLHMDVGPGDRFFWFTTTGWMMWNVVVSALMLGAGIVLYDGSPSLPDWSALWRLAAAAGVTWFGTSAPHLMACARAGVEPGRDVDLHGLRAVGSTGAPLPPEGFRWVYEHVKEDVLLASVSGGTDVCTAFAASCPWLPVRAGEIQCRALGARIESFDPAGAPLQGEVGELVLTQPMPSMPLFLWNDDDGRRYRESYFEAYPGVWRHGDWVRITPSGGLVISGRSDATLNRGGVRTGSADFYRVVEAMAEVADSLVVDTADAPAETGGQTAPRQGPRAGEASGEVEGARAGSGALLLFVVLEGGVDLDPALAERIRERLRRDLSPRHVPDEIHAVAEVPRTLNGKKLEVPVKRILQGAPPDEVVSRGALANPEALVPFVELAARRRGR